MKIRAQGEGFFARAETMPYHPTGSVIGQTHRDSCVAACCRMLLQDDGQDVGEPVIRAALSSDNQGALLSSAPHALRELGSSISYSYRNNLPIADLRQSVIKSPAIVFVKDRPQSAVGHVMIIDGFENGWVLIRDPWPLASGAAYRVRLSDFKAVWLVKTNGGELAGRAVVVGG